MVEARVLTQADISYKCEIHASGVKTFRFEMLLKTSVDVHSGTCSRSGTGLPPQFAGARYVAPGVLETIHVRLSPTQSQMANPSFLMGLFSCVKSRILDGGFSGLYVGGLKGVCLG